MNDYLRGQIDAYCYMVERGKPAAMMPIHKRLVDEARNMIRENYLKSFAEDLAYDWSVLWIYKYGHILEVIKSLQQEPKSVFDHWILGKLFGYDESAIQEYLSQF